MGVRALTFDVFPTLLDWRTGIVNAFRECGLEEDPEELAVDWRSRLWPSIAEVNRGRRPWSDFDALQEATLAELLADRGLELSAAGRSALVRAWHRIDPWPDVQEGLEALRTERVTAALSNCHTALLIGLARHADLRFDCLLSAELVRRYKPEAEVYLNAVRLLGLEPDEVMMVAAHPLDLKAARRAGLRSAFIDRPLEDDAGLPAGEDPDAEISVSDLHELAARLGPPPVSGRGGALANRRGISNGPRTIPIVILEPRNGRRQ